MGNSSREKVKENFKIVSDKITEIEKKKPVQYATASKYVPKIGLITDVKTIKDIVKLQAIVDEHKSNFDAAASKLGIDESELEEDNETTFMGHTLAVWDADIKNRLTEIKEINLLVKLQKAKKLLKKNLSTEDKFDLDMESIGDVLSMDDFNAE